MDNSTFIADKWIWCNPVLAVRWAAVISLSPDYAQVAKHVSAQITQLYFIWSEKNVKFISPFRICQVCICSVVSGKSIGN